MGQTVKVDVGTKYHSDVNNVILAGLGDLNTGNVIEVSGLIQADGKILATYIELKSTSCNLGDEYEVKGIISNLGASTFQINSVTVDYSNLTPDKLPSGGLSDGLFVEVKTTDCYNGGNLVASQVEGLKSGISGNEGDIMELEGFITQFHSSTDFYVNGQHVSTTDGTIYKPAGKTSGDLKNNIQVELEGKLDANGVLIANTISFDD